MNFLLAGLTAFNVLLGQPGGLLALAASQPLPSYCEAVEGMANSIMGARQQGASMSVMFDIANDPKRTTGNAELDARMRDITRMIILDAYEQPEYMMAENKTREARVFSTKYRLACEKGIQ